MRVVLTEANLFVEPGLKLVLSGTRDELQELGKQVAARFPFRLESEVAEKGGENPVCNFEFPTNEKEEKYSVECGEAYLSMSQVTSDEASVRLFRLSDGAPGSFQFIDLRDFNNEDFSLIVELARE